MRRSPRRKRMTERIKMSPENKDSAIKITLDDLANVSLPENGGLVPAAQMAGSARVYGSVNEASGPQTQVAEEKGSLLLQGALSMGSRACPRRKCCTECWAERSERDSEGSYSIRSLC